MKSRQLGYVLLAIIVLGLIGVAVRLVASESDLPVLKVQATLSDGITDRVVMRDSFFSTTLRKDGDSWKVGPYPVVEWKLDALWEVAGRFDGADLIAVNPSNHALMGVSPFNNTVVEFWSGDVLQEELLLGHREFIVEGEYKASPWTRQVQLCYIRREGSDDVFGVFCPLPDQFHPHPNAWSEPLIATVPRFDVETITYKYPDEEFTLIQDGADWLLEPSDTSTNARLITVFDLREQLELFVASDFPAEEVRGTVDFSDPYLILRLGLDPTAEKDEVLFLFLQREEGGYYVKEATKPYFYVLFEDDAADVVVPREEFEPLESATP